MTHTPLRFVKARWHAILWTALMTWFAEASPPARSNVVDVPGAFEIAA